MNSIIIDNYRIKKHLEHIHTVNMVSVDTSIIICLKTFKQVLNMVYGLYTNDITHHVLLYPEQTLSSTIDQIKLSIAINKLIDEGHTFEITTLCPVLLQQLNIDDCFYKKYDSSINNHFKLIKLASTKNKPLEIISYSITTQI